MNCTLKHVCLTCKGLKFITIRISFNDCSKNIILIHKQIWIHNVKEGVHTLVKLMIFKMKTDTWKLLLYDQKVLPQKIITLNIITNLEYV